MNAFGTGVTSMRPLIYDKKVFVGKTQIINLHMNYADNYNFSVVSNENNAGQQAEIFQLSFIHRNALTEYHDKTLSWCKSALRVLQIEEIQREIVGSPGRSDMPDSAVSPSDFFGEWQQSNNSNVSILLNQQISLQTSHFFLKSF